MWVEFAEPRPAALTRCLALQYALLFPGEELSRWAQFDVPAGVQEEKGVQYEFQMWVRD